MTFPKGNPKAMISVSETSLGSFLIWRTRDGGASPTLSSTLNFLLSLPLDVPSNKEMQQKHTLQQNDPNHDKWLILTLSFDWIESPRA